MFEVTTRVRSYLCLILVRRSNWKSSLRPNLWAVHSDRQLHTANCRTSLLISRDQTSLPYSPVRYVFSFRIFGDLKKLYIFGNVRIYWIWKTMFTFFQAPYGRHLGFSKWRLFFLKSGNISASNHPRHMILVSKHTF